MSGRQEERQNGGQGFGGGEQGERLEGSLTDGGSVPGKDEEEDRRFGAGREPPPANPEATAEEAVRPGEEKSGYGNTPPR